MRLFCLTLLAPFLLAISTRAMSDSATPGVVIAGWVEKVTVLPAELVVKAKLDTGASTSSIHARNIERFRRGKEKWVRFELVLESTDDHTHWIPMERPLKRRIRIKDHDDEDDPRLVIELEFCMDGRQHQAEFSLADRSKFIYPVLLGREFLSGIAVVDPARTFLTTARCQ